jgi:hypothetical protein
MTDILYVVRYFQVVPPVPRLMGLCFVAVTAICGGLTALHSAGDAAAAMPIVVLQAFGASTGFTVPARRGYFDLLIARGQSRIRIAGVQWLLAITPGLASWAILASVHSMVHAGANPFVRSGTAVAFLMASTVPWAANVSLPRFSGAIGWLLLACLARSGGVIWPDNVIEVVIPIELIGRTLSDRLDLLVPAIVLSIASMAIALTWVRRTDLRLQAAQ